MKFEIKGNFLQLRLHNERIFSTCLNFFSLEIIFHDDTISIGYSVENACLTVDFEAFDTCREAYQRALEEALSFISFKSTQKIIFNQSKKSFFRKEDTSWAWNDWLPRLSQCLGKQGKLAVVLPKKMLWNIEKTSKTAFPFENKVFSSVEEANHWLNK